MGGSGRGMRDSGKDGGRGSGRMTGAREGEGAMDGGEGWRGDEGEQGSERRGGETGRRPLARYRGEGRGRTGRGEREGERRGDGHCLDTAQGRMKRTNGVRRGRWTGASDGARDRVIDGNERRRDGRGTGSKTGKGHITLKLT